MLFILLKGEGIGQVLSIESCLAGESNPLEWLVRLNCCSSSVVHQL